MTLRGVSTNRVARGVLALVIAVTICFSLSASDTDARFNKVGGKLMCTCGCAQTLLGCDHVGCPSRGDEMAKLKNGIAGGGSDQEILASFVQDYGKVVLAAPPTEGFDLVAWIMPFAVAALALLGTIFLVRHWIKTQPKLAPVGATGSAAERDAMQERIRRETGTE